MAAIIFSLVLLMALGNFADFLIGKEGARKSKDRLVSLYIAMNEGQWTAIPQTVGYALADFMAKLLGPRGWSLRYIMRIIGISIILNGVVAILMLEMMGSLWKAKNASGIPTALFIAMLTLSNIPTDVLSWRSAHGAFERLSTAEDTWHLFAVSFFKAIGFYVLSFSSYMFCFAIFLYRPTFGGMLMDIIFLPVYAVIKLLRPSVSDGIWPGMGAMAPLLPHALFLLLIALCFVLKKSQRFLQAPLSLILQRAEESPKGIFTLTATAFAAFTAILGAARNL